MKLPSLLTCCCGVLAVALVIPLYALHLRHAPERQLQAHRDLWTSRHLTHYSYHFSMWPMLTQADVEIKNGKTVKYVQTQGDDFGKHEHETMESYFDAVEENFKGVGRQYEKVTVNYDPVDGYPTEVQCYLQGYAHMSDSVPGYGITNFKRLP